MGQALMEFRLTSTAFGPRAPELLQAALDRLAASATISSLCAAAILTEGGAIYIVRTEILMREPVRHALTMAVMEMLRTYERKVLMALIVRRDERRPPRLMLPCGYCRMLLYAYGGPDVRIVSTSPHTQELTLVSLDELMPHADGGLGRELPTEPTDPPKPPHE